MKTATAWRCVDLAAAAIVFGLLWLGALSPLGFVPWFGALLSLAVVAAWRDRLPAWAQRWLVRPAAIVLGIGAAGYTLAAWLVTAVHHPWVWMAIALAAGWLGLLLAGKRDPFAALLVAAGVGPAIFIVTEARLIAPDLMAPATGLALVVLLTAGFAGRLGVVGRPFMLMFFVLATSMAANDVFFHGADSAGVNLRPQDGVATVFAWRGQSTGNILATVGTDLHFAGEDAHNRLLIGSKNGVFTVENHVLRPQPLGPAAENYSLDRKSDELFVATRDGILSRILDARFVVTDQAILPNGARVTGLAPEGLYVLDGWRDVGLYRPANLRPLRHWDVGPASDLVPDGEGGFFVATLSGWLTHIRADETTTRAPLGRRGVFHSLALDAARGRILATNLLDDEMLVFSTHDLSFLWRAPVGFGARNVTVEADTGAVVVGRYFAGELLVLNGDNYAEFGRLDVGRRVRSIVPMGNGRVMVTSAAGIFVVDLAKVFPDVTPPTLEFPEN